jgi:DNA helicase-2/ATP-dependent DNA helicase PcrA
MYIFGMGVFEDRYGKLNPQQKEAVDHITGPLLVVAGPGTGKTEILGLRVANILRKTDTSPLNILCLTFTNSASFNMRDRLAKLIGQDAYKVAIHTFHSFGVEIISGYPEYFYKGAEFYPIDDLGQIQIVEEIIGELPHDDQLKNRLPDGGYVYSGSIRSAIGHLKKAGLTPEEFKQILENNLSCFEYLNPRINSVFGPRISKKAVGLVEDFIENLTSVPAEETPSAGINSFVDTVRSSLIRILDDVAESASTKPLTNWKSVMTRKDDAGSLVLRDSTYSEKLFTLADIYEKYQDRMYELRYYDYEDMILEAIRGIKEHNSLRYELQDRYDYILVDEFQDTNDAQLRLLRLLTTYDEEGRLPNVMAVGDDDQAIYKFQGAELSNVLNFGKFYPDAKTITITSNYRSTQDILDLARFVILKGEERLENHYPDINKDIRAANKDVLPGVIISKSFHTSTHEFYWVANEIKRLVDAGKQPSDIAVIARNHKQLEEIAMFLNHRELPLKYERFNNVLDEPHVHQLIQISRFLNSLGRKNKDDADEYLPEILSYPFWNLSRKTIWEIAYLAERSGRKRLRWLDVMQSYDDERVKTIAGFLLDLGVESASETLEKILDKIMGAHEQLAPESEEDETESAEEITKNKFISPFKDFYFSDKVLKKNGVEYVRFLSGLRTFIQALREYRKGNVLKIEELVEFVELHVKNNVPIIDDSYFVNASDAVTLLTAHRAKGLEFETVFIINCQEEIWTGRGRSSNLPFPMNLPITPAGDTIDDQLRLFYVALTRAKSNLYLTSYEMKDNGNRSSRLHFIMSPTEDEKAEDEIRKVLTPDEGQSPEVSDVQAMVDVLNASWESYHAPPVVHDERAVLESLLENYKLSVTHLNNYLDVTAGGPRLFFEQNLLRFPQSKTVAGSYGSAIHRTIEAIYKHIKSGKDAPSLETVLDWYERELIYERMSDRDFRDYSNKGKEALSLFYKKKLGEFDPSHYSEVDFHGQGVVVGGAHLTGKIDKMVPRSGNEISVHDFKTGKPKKGWKSNEYYEKIQLHQYRRQLVFYKALVEHSKQFGGKYKVNRGVLEFVQPDKNELFDLTAEIDGEEYELTTALAKIVFDKIINLDFPDVSGYKEDISGIQAFEHNLLEGKV